MFEQISILAPNRCLFFSNLMSSNRVAFIDALVEMNAPETLIKNRDALKQFRQMKENNAPPPTKRTKAIRHHHPPGI